MRVSNPTETVSGYAGQLALDEIRSNLEVAPEEEQFIGFLAKHFNPKTYLELHPDVAKAGADPLEHWLHHGLDEGRRISPNMDVLYGKSAESISARNWTRYRWREKTVAVRIFQPISANIITQIVNQARHDPALLAAGEGAIANLRKFDATDLLARNGVDFASLLAAIPRRPEIVIIMPYMYIGGAEKYTACLVSALQATGSGSIQVLVTHQESAENPDWNKLAILEPLRSVNVLFWRDICVNHSKSFVLACLLNGLRPRAVIVVNSRVGLDAVAKFGLALSQYSRLYCAYFGLGVQAVGPTFGNRFPRHTLRFATALTDNELTAATLRERYGNLLGQDVVVLPPQVAPVTEEEFNKRLILRRRRIASVARPLRWVWVGRIGRLKGTQILSKLAKRRPIDRFEMFGPLRRSLNDLGLVRPNIFHSAC